MHRINRAWSLFGLLAIGLAALTVSPLHAQQISTVSQWGGSNDVGSFGVTSTETYGETITATAQDQVLNNFTFYLEPGADSAPQFNAYVGLWNPTPSDLATLLWTSPTSYTGPTNSGFTPYTFDTGNLQLASGDQYVLFVSASNDDQTAGLDNLGLAGSAYSGGQFVYLNNGNDFGELSTTGWTNFKDEDLAFTANFGSPAPEPSGLEVSGITILALMGLALTAKLRRHGRVV